ncbi:anti-sigma factor family protein [Streptomyces sp. NPDC048297]|uniref:anti-sigma factor family protein n=1 Tax=Streptomyces sp. NPDC048297 TaxID=3365531 RepID=UPI00371F05AF
MTTQQHRNELLGAYVLGVLGDEEARQVEEHLASCQECRTEVAEMRLLEEALGEVPPEAFLDGPPDDADLLLQRTLRQARSERTASQRRRSFTIGMAAAASAAVVFLGGYLVSGTGSSGATAQRPPVTTTAGPTTVTPPAGVKVASGVDPVTQARMVVKVTPAAGWVRLNAAVSGVPAGQRCRLVVVSKDGSRSVAGSWIVGKDGHGGGKGADLDGSASIAPHDVSSVVVENEAGKKFVSVQV